MFPEVKSRETSGLEENNWFPEGLDVSYFIIFQEFHFNSNKE